ncbi:hypothetical protein NI401_10850 [Acinetobacter indicus]|nr:hypothetical protein [Acinetobacter indicus]MCO8103395.1 hypothetical protein [Acinetobacter indicus]
MSHFKFYSAMHIPTTWPPKAYQNNLKLAKSFDLDEEFMIERLKEITA